MVHHRFLKPQNMPTTCKHSEVKQKKINLRALYTLIKEQLETRQLVCEASNPINTTM